jgi:hypothetical protein
VLEGDAQHDPRLALEIGDGIAQQLPRAAVPGRVVGLKEVARKKCSLGVPSSKSTLASALRSGIRMRSPKGPKGEGAIVPMAVNMMLVGVQPTPLASRFSR